jgi:hypothetical protein
MSTTRLHRLTTIYLAALYGVVGLTGESLHYLASDPLSLWSSSPPEADTVVYYHIHAPDFHGHFHRHTRNEHHTHVHVDATHDAPHAHDGIAIAPQQLNHEPHACPLLTLVSTIKLGHFGVCATHVVLDPLVTKTFERSDSFALQVVRSSYARGPPHGSVA